MLTLKHATQPFLQALAGNKLLAFVLAELGFLEVLPENHAVAQPALDALGQVCVLLPEVCTSSLGIFADTRLDLVNADRISLYFQRFSAGTSLRNLDHMGQIMAADRFQRYDFGVIGNLAKYAALSPPEIDVSQIEVPVAMFVGKHDTLATSLDNLEQKAKLKNLVRYQECELDHLGFILAKNMSYFTEVVASLDEISRES